MNESNFPKLITWAFLCTTAEINTRGGVNATHIYDKFLISELPGISLVLRVDVPRQGDIAGGLQPYTWLREFSLGIIIKSDTEEDIDSHASNLLVADQIHVMPIGQMISHPGHYLVEVFVDGSLQHKLDLFISSEF